MARRPSGLVLLVLLCTAAPGPAQVAVGSLVVFQVADRTSSSAQAVTLNVYTPNAASTSVSLTGTITVASAGATQLTAAGNDVTGGSLSVNPNNTITFAGYRADTGTANVSGSLSATVNRVVGILDLAAGSVNTNTQLSNTYDGLAFRSAATADGQHYYLSGQSGTGGGPQLANLGSPGPPGGVTTVSSTTGLTASQSDNTGQIQVAGGNLFVAGRSANPGQQVFQVGSGLPIAGSQSLTGSFGPQGVNSAYNSFAFARLGTGATWNGTGYDTIYAVNNDSPTNASVQKWTYNGTTFAASGSISVANVNHVAVRQNPTSVDVFVTTSGSSGSALLAYTDATGFDHSIAGGAFTSLLTAAGDAGFFGVAVTPVPETATGLAFAAAALGLVGAASRAPVLGRRTAVVAA